MKTIHLMQTAFAATVATLAAMPAFAGYSLAYHGRLVTATGAAVSTKRPMQMEFRLYTQAEPGETAPLWGRRVAVMLDSGGQFYTELNDEAGTASSRAKYSSLGEAIASASGGDVYISLTPAGCSELLPRKRITSIHRALKAQYAASARRAEAPLLSAPGATVGNLAIDGDLHITNSFQFAGSTIVTKITKSGASLGGDGGSVTFSDTFDCWRFLYPDDNSIGDASMNSFGTKTIKTDTIAGFPYTAEKGVCSIPVVEGTPTTSLPKPVRVDSFMPSEHSPFE